MPRIGRRLRLLGGAGLLVGAVAVGPPTGDAEAHNCFKVVLAQPVTTTVGDPNCVTHDEQTHTCTNENSPVVTIVVCEEDV